jgi:hypothetical protein
MESDLEDLSLEVKNMLLLVHQQEFDGHVAGIREDVAEGTEVTKPLDYLLHDCTEFLYGYTDEQILAHTRACVSTLRELNLSFEGELSDVVGVAFWFITNNQLVLLGNELGLKAEDWNGATAYVFKDCIELDSTPLTKGIVDRVKVWREAVGLPWLGVQHKEFVEAILDAPQGDETYLHHEELAQLLGELGISAWELGKAAHTHGIPADENKYEWRPQPLAWLIIQEVLKQGTSREQLQERLKQEGVYESAHIGWKALEKTADYEWQVYEGGATGDYTLSDYHRFLTLQVLFSNEVLTAWETKKVAQRFLETTSEEQRKGWRIVGKSLCFLAGVSEEEDELSEPSAEELHQIESEESR